MTMMKSMILSEMKTKNMKRGEIIASVLLHVLTTICGMS